MTNFIAVLVMIRTCRRWRLKVCKRCYAFIAGYIGKKSLLVDLAHQGTGDAIKTNEFSDKFQTAFEPPVWIENDPPFEISPKIHPFCWRHMRGPKSQ